MTIDFDLLERAVDDAATGVGGVQHQQMDWIAPLVGMERAPECNTGMCLAGFMATRAGAEQPVPHICECGCGEWEFPLWYLDGQTGKLRKASAGGIHISQFAMERAGLAFDQADALFRGSNTITQIRAMVNHLREHPDASGGDLHTVRREASL